MIVLKMIKIILGDIVMYLVASVRRAGARFLALDIFELTLSGMVMLSAYSGYYHWYGLAKLLKYPMINDLRTIDFYILPGLMTLVYFIIYLVMWAIFSLLEMLICDMLAASRRYMRNVYERAKGW